MWNPTQRSYYILKPYQPFPATAGPFDDGWQTRAHTQCVNVDFLVISAKLERKFPMSNSTAFNDDCHPIIDSIRNDYMQHMINCKEIPSACFEFSRN